MSSARWLIATTAGRFHVSRTVVEVTDEIRDAALERRDVLGGQVGDLDAAVVLHRAHRRHDDRRRGAHARRAGQDVDELLGAEVGAEPGLGHDVVGEPQRGLRRDRRVAAVRDVGERAAVDERGRVLEGLHEVRRERVAEDRGHRAVRVEVAGPHGLPVARVADDDVAEPLLEVGETGREAEDGHHLARDDDVEARLARIAVARPAEADDDVAERAVVDVEHAPPGDAPDVDAERVAVLDVVVDERCEQVGGDADRREVTREVEVDVFHRHDLRVPAAGGAALHAEDRPERGLAQAHDRAFADPRERVAEADGGGRLALTGGRGRDRGDEHEPALRPVGDRVEEPQRDLRLVAAVRLETLLGDAEAVGDLRDGQHPRSLGDLDVAEPHWSSPASSSTRASLRGRMPSAPGHDRTRRSRPGARRTRATG